MTSPEEVVERQSAKEHAIWKKKNTEQGGRMCHLKIH